MVRCCFIFLFCLELLRCKMIGNANTQQLDGAGHKPSKKVYIQSMPMIPAGRRTHV